MDFENATLLGKTGLTECSSFFRNKSHEVREITFYFAEVLLYRCGCEVAHQCTQIYRTSGSSVWNELLRAFESKGKEVTEGLWRIFYN